MDWDVAVLLPDGSRDRLASAICHLNDQQGWSTVCIAVWLLLLEAGWTVEVGSLCWRRDAGPPLLLDLPRYREVMAEIERAYGREPRHPIWERVADPAWWASRMAQAGARPDAGSAEP